ncbi:glucan biosynthesis protein [Stappia sp. MMSF_3263]|uniref:glucan biosynthesis protein n=1 Tax=Stappia sp. MMSF_3263 TaxID=3046693 RepID=UPI00273FC9B6|nr:glucan biosynthesis protein [Stappia sp. MMSF_3263]
MTTIDKRSFLTGSAGLLATLLGSVALPAFADEAAPATPPAGSEPPAKAAGTPFDWEGLVARMKAKAGEPYDAQAPEFPEAIANLTYDAHRAIRFRPDHALWKTEERNFELQAFYPGWVFGHTVDMFEVVGGEARPMGFSADDFEYREPLDPAAFNGVAFPGPAGFRLHYPLNRNDYRDELITFLGSSYFRALGRGNVYGLSARGLAVDTASGSAEEFPRFSRFYIERPEAGAREIRLYAELESPRVSGAYAFTILPGVETLIDVEAAIFLRGDVSRLGLAPLTSMYLFGENDRTGFDDFRPEVHDSDGLAILRGNGERVWRALANPARLQLSVFGDENPRGFGLLQRDRAADNYLDAEARYERRPSVWIEPVGDWGKGAVLLAEIPTDSEANDNVVAFWMPEGGLSAGSEHRLRYRMIWARDVEGDVPLARVLRTRTGRGGNSAAEGDANVRKFLVDFSGETLAGLGEESAVEAKLGVNNGKIAHLILNQMPGSDVWRLIVDVKRVDADQPVELSAALLLEGERLTETWTYQWGQAT